MVTDNSKKDWLVIVNPNAGKGKGEKDWHKIAKLLRDHLKFQAVFTGYKRHAIKLGFQGIEQGYKKIIVVGGDGTMNEVVNAVFKQKRIPTDQITLGMITVGTGNDWAHMFGISHKYREAVETILQKKIFLQDAGIVSYFKEDQPEERYFINMAGLGFDAMVVEKANRQKEMGKSGMVVYLANILSNLWKYNHLHTHIRIDHHVIKEEVFTISIGIGRYTGGGMRQTPDSIPDDGLFDLTVIKKMKKLNVLRSLPMLYNGKIKRHPKVHSFRGSHIRIDSDPPINVEVDGESLGHSPIEIKSLPKSIRVITGLRS